MLSILTKLAHSGRINARIGSLCALFCILPGITSSFAATTTTYANPIAIQHALASADHVNLLGIGKSGFTLDSAYFSGPASGIANGTPPSLASAPSLYALLIDGRYDFNADELAISSDMHPYVLGSMGMATVGPLGAASAFSGKSGEASPLFRIGGGVTYRLGEQWNLSLDYKTGFAPSAFSGDQVVTGRNQQPVDLQALDFGMKYSF